MSKQKDDDSILGMLKLGVILAVYAVVSCTVLAVVNNFTSPKIAQNQIKKVNDAMVSFFYGDGYSFEQKSDYEIKNIGSIKIESIILAKKDGKVCGGAAQVTGPTYDTATILVGIARDGTVKGVQFLKNTDSPGFGLKASDPNFKLASGKTFYGQFEGKNALEVFEIGKNFDAISGATISSNGVASLINAGTTSLFNYIESIEKAEAQNE